MAAQELGIPPEIRGLSDRFMSVRLTRLDQLVGKGPEKLPFL